MPQQLEPVTLRGFHRGMADYDSVADSMMPSTQMRLIVNMNEDRLGHLERRLGCVRLGSAEVIAGNTMLGLHNHISSTAANSQIVAFINQANDTTAEAYYLSGSTWTNKALSFTADTKIRAVTFLNLIMAVNGTDAPKSWTGAAAAAWGTTSLVTAPTGSLIETYKQQVYIADTATDTVYFSSIPTGGAITWTTATDNFILNPNDGSSITALKRYAQELLIFKDDYLYRYNAVSTDADPIILYGTPVQEAVTVAAGVCWFYDANRSNIYGYAGGYPDPIGYPVQAFLKAIPTSNFTSVSMRGDDNHIELYIGDVTVNNIAFTNVALRYRISSQTWTVRSYAHDFEQFKQYDDGTDLWVLGGTDDGHVLKMDSGNLDLTTDISYELETPWYTIGGNPALEFKLATFSAFVERASGDLMVQYRTDEDETWQAIGNCRKYVSSWSGINAGFHRIKFRFTGRSATDPVIFDGFSMLIPLLEGVEKGSYGIR